VPARLAAICGLLASLTYTIGWLVADLVQPARFSSADDDISDLGAKTATSPWIHNQIGANLTGILVVVFALGLWRSVWPDLVGRLGAGGLILVGLAQLLEGFLRLDCQGIDVGCENTSWSSDGHRLVSVVGAVMLTVTPLVLAFAYRTGATPGFPASPRSP
jgi:hypothetical protein